MQHQARFNTRAGFTLLELLIVLFLLTLGYVSLFSSGLGQQPTTADDRQTVVTESRDIIRYARRLALAKGSPIAVKFGPNKIQLLALDGTTVPSPADATQPYQVESTFTFKDNQPDLRSEDPATELYFDDKGRLVSRKNTNAAMEPYQTAVIIALEGYTNANNVSSYSDGGEAFLLISNVTGELIAL